MKFKLSFKGISIAVATAILIQPFLSFAAPQIPVDISLSGDSKKPTISWSPVADGVVDPTEWVEKGDKSVRWSQRVNFASTVFDGKMWVFGNTGDASATNDVWSSSDGSNWTQVTDSAPWPGRYNTQAITFNGKMWIIGGQRPNSGPPIFANDVWSSTDGVNWTEETSSADWVGRSLHATVVFDSKLWVIGGNNISGYINDAWSTTDGINWTQETSNPGWAGRSRYSVLSYNDKLWLMGGSDSTNKFNEVWSSTDGVTWSEETASADWSVRHLHSSAVFDNKMWVVGGADSSNTLSDVWSSTDGVNWTEASADAGWYSRSGAALMTLNNKLWLMGGARETNNTNTLNDVWNTTNGTTWTELTKTKDDTIWTGRAGHNVVVFDDKLWFAGGNDGSNNNNDVWSSTDGLNWTKVTENAQWSARSDSVMAAYDGRLWIIGDNSGVSDVWSSPDGVTWTEETADAGWVSRYGHASAVFDDKLWIMGGTDASTYESLNDVWYTTNGSDWTQATAGAQWAGREYFGKSVPVLDGKMWIIGGESDSTDSYLIDDVWSSSDGVTWTQETSNAPWGERGYHTSVAFDDKLWVIGGYYGDDWTSGADIWYSVDGANWTLATDSAPWGAANSQEGIVFNDRLWVASGYSDDDSAYIRGIWSIKNNAIDYYKVCWDTVDGQCTYSANVDREGTALSVSNSNNFLAQIMSVLSPTASAATGQLSYTLPNTLAPGSWYFSVSAVTYEGDQSVLSDSVRAVVSDGSDVTTTAPGSDGGGTVALVDAETETDSQAGSDEDTTPIAEAGGVNENADIETEENSNNGMSNIVMWGLIIIAILTVTIGAYRFNRKNN